ncbi:MAG TPA: hypothetical protein VNI77_01550 [Nitrososphaera sp.]|nr:hypothetical protein [Nitrososphaera sp.]
MPLLSGLIHGHAVYVVDKVNKGTFDLLFEICIVFDQVAFYQGICVVDRMAFMRNSKL